MYSSMSPAVRSAKVELSEPELRQYLARYLRRRLPAADAEDALQAVYCAALEAQRLPEERTELRRWLTVVARRKVAAYYERASSEQLGDPPELVAQPPSIEASSLLRWAERQAAESQLEHVNETLDWMARESDGEKLEAIAAEAAVPSTRVRQRVFRLRRFMKARWALELAAAALGIVLVLLWSIFARRTEPVAKPVPAPAPSASVVAPPDDGRERAAELRQRALRSCALARYDECLSTLDEAGKLDPAGDSEPSVVEARKTAIEKLTPRAPTPKPSVSKPTSKSKNGGTPSTGTSAN